MYDDLEASAQIGQVLAGKYRVERVLGVGGMGVVVAAVHLQLDQLVALKFIRREALSNAEIVARFEREARSVVRLKSEHVARVLDVGRLNHGSPYIVMEYLEGQDLSELLRQRGKLALDVACDFIIQACDAMAEAHRLSIVHRDLKPGNLYLATTAHGQQTIKVLDFGISKTQLSALDASATRTQAIMGSPGYMSPEQIRSTKNVDQRSDVWSLGVILYELITGQTPFQADTMTALCVKIATEPHVPLPRVPVALPAGFEAVIDRVLEKDPAKRYQSTIELACALAPFAPAAARDRAYRLGSSMPGLATAPHPASSPPFAETTLGGAGGQAQAARATGGRRRAWMVAVAAIVLAAGVGGELALSTSSGASARDGQPQDVRPAAPVARPAAPVAPVTAIAVLDAGSPDSPPDAGSALEAAAPPAVPPVDAGRDRARAHGTSPGSRRPAPNDKANDGGAAQQLDPFATPD